MNPNNLFILNGNLTKAPILRETENGKHYAFLNLAVDNGYGKDAKPDYLSVAVWGKQAENCERFLKKGRLVGVQGRLQTGSYTNKDGATVYTTDVVADRVEFLEWGDRQSSNDGFGQAMSAPREAAPQSAPAAQDDFTPEGFTAIEEDIPF